MVKLREIEENKRARWGPRLGYCSVQRNAQGTRTVESRDDTGSRD